MFIIPIIFKTNYLVIFSYKVNTFAEVRLSSPALALRSESSRVPDSFRPFPGSAPVALPDHDFDVEASRLIL